MTPLPHDVEAERQVLSCIFLDPTTADLVSEDLTGDDMYVEANRIVWDAVQAVRARGIDPDPITVRSELHKSKKLQAVGGDEYLLELTSSIPSTARVEAYAKVIREKALHRRMIQAAQKIMVDGMGLTGDVAEYLDGAESAIFEAGKERHSVKAYEPIRAVLMQRFKELREASESGKRLMGLKTGILDLDKTLSGLNPGKLYVVAGRPSMGKSAFACKVADSVAAAGSTVYVASLEMTKQEWVDRFLSGRARVDGNRIRSASFMADDWKRIAAAAGELAEFPIQLDDTTALKMVQLRSRCRRVKAKHGLGLVIVDYLQLMRSGQKFSDRHDLEIGAIATGLKNLAKELEVPVLALSQLNRGVENRQDKRPNMGDLRESGQIEQDADAIVFLYRDEVYNPKSNDEGTAELIVAKQRGGPIGTVKARFWGEFTRFENLEEQRESSPLN